MVARLNPDVDSASFVEAKFVLAYTGGSNLFLQTYRHNFVVLGFG